MEIHDFPCTTFFLEIEDTAKRMMSRKSHDCDRGIRPKVNTGLRILAGKLCVEICQPQIIVNLDHLHCGLTEKSQVRRVRGKMVESGRIAFAELVAKLHNLGL